MRNILRNKKGATLVELTIVIALVAIICSMVGVFMASFQGSVYTVTNAADLKSDLDNIRVVLGNWVLSHDSALYDISVDEDGTLKATVQEGMYETLQTSQVSTAEQKDSAVTLSADKKYLQIGDQQLSLNAVTDCTFEMEDNVVVVSIPVGDGSTQELLFTVFTKTQRARYSSALTQIGEEVAAQ